MESQNSFQIPRLTARGMVQHVLFQVPGVFYTVSELRSKILSKYRTHLQRKTIIAALGELSTSTTRLVYQVRRIGPFRIPVKHYAIT